MVRTGVECDGAAIFDRPLLRPQQPACRFRDEGHDSQVQLVLAVHRLVLGCIRHPLLDLAAKEYGIAANSSQKVVFAFRCNRRRCALDVDWPVDGAQATKYAPDLVHTRIETANTDVGWSCASAPQRSQVRRKQLGSPNQAKLNCSKIQFPLQ